MKERYQKVLSSKLEEYPPSDVIPMQEADLEVYLRRYVSGFIDRAFCFILGIYKHV